MAAQIAQSSQNLYQKVEQDEHKKQCDLYANIVRYKLYKLFEL